MEENQADSIVRAVLEPDPEAREKLRRKREAEDRGVALGRFTAAFVLAGFAVGMALAHFAGERLTVGGLWGAIGGAAIGQLVGTWHGHPRGEDQ